MSDTVLYTFVVLYNIWKSVRGFTAQHHVQWILSTTVSEDELQKTLTFISFLYYSKIANFHSFITISHCLNYHSGRARMKPSLERDFGYTIPYKHRRKLSPQLWMGLQAYFCWASNAATWHIKASLHWLNPQKIIIWSLFLVLLGYKTAFNLKPGIVTALILILWITYEAPFLNVSKVNVKARSFFAIFFFFLHTVAIYDNSEITCEEVIFIG